MVRKGIFNYVCHRMRNVDNKIEMYRGTIQGNGFRLCMHACVRAGMCACVRAGMCVQVRECTSVCTYIRVYVCMSA